MTFEGLKSFSDNIENLIHIFYSIDFITVKITTVIHIHNSKFLLFSTYLF